MSNTSYDDVRFVAIQGAYYHADMAAFHSLLNKTLGFGVVVLSTSAALGVAVKIGIAPEYLDLSAVIFATLNLVFLYSEHSHMHAVKSQQYRDIQKRLVMVGPTNARALRHMEAELISLRQDEGPAHMAVAALAWNVAYEDCYGDHPLRHTHLKYLTWYHRVLRHVLPFQGVRFEPPRSKPKSHNTAHVEPDSADMTGKSSSKRHVFAHEPHFLARGPSLWHEQATHDNRDHEARGVTEKR